MHVAAGQRVQPRQLGGMASYGLPFPLADQVFGTLQVPFGAVDRAGYLGCRFGVVLGTEIARPAVEAAQPGTGLAVHGA